MRARLRARFIVRWAAEVRLARRRSLNMSDSENRPASLTWKSPGRQVNLTRTFQMSPPISFSRSKNSPRITPNLSAIHFAWAALPETPMQPIPPSQNRDQRRETTFRNGVWIACAILIAIIPLSASQKYEVTGVLLQVDPQHHSITVSCKEIPGYMDAMAMPFTVQDSKLFDGLEPGMSIDFTLVVDKDSTYAEDIRIHPFESLELDPTEARRYKVVENAMAARSSADVLHVGQPVPDFSLTDQSRQPVSLSQFAGKVVAITFINTRCPRPDYCVRLSNNFGLLQRRFPNRLGSDLILLTIVIDPVHDQPETLTSYANTWKADPRTWHFL